VEADYAAASIMLGLPTRVRCDPAQLAKLMIDIASGEVEDKIFAPNTPASEFARQGGLKGGRARADKPNNVTKPRRIIRGYAAYYDVSRSISEQGRPSLSRD
jgi:hypothetical protein